MQRILVSVKDQQEWYSVVREANRWFGTGNWRGQRRVRRQLATGALRWMREPRKVWFEVPDVQFASWIMVKYTLPVELVNKEDSSEIAE